MPGVWALGDVNGRGGFTHTSYHEHEVVVADLVEGRERSAVGRARVRGESQGFMKGLVDAHSERIVGAALLGIEADEVIHALLALMYAGASYRVMRDAVHIHPTVAELLPTLLGQLEPLGGPEP